MVLQDGTCDVANEMAYIISRRRLLSNQGLQRMLLILILSVVVYVADQQEKFRAAYETVRNHLKAAAEKRKAYYDANVRARHFQEGDRVWYFYPRQYTRTVKEVEFRICRPLYRVEENLGFDVSNPEVKEGQADYSPCRQTETLHGTNRSRGWW